MIYEVKDGPMPSSPLRTSNIASDMRMKKSIWLFIDIDTGKDIDGRDMYLFLRAGHRGILIHLSKSVPLA